MEIVALLDALTPHRQIQSMVATLIFAGLRREESLRLRRRDVDLEARVIRIRSKKGVYSPWP